MSCRAGIAHRYYVPEEPILRADLPTTQSGATKTAPGYSYYGPKKPILRADPSNGRKTLEKVARKTRWRAKVIPGVWGLLLWIEWRLCVRLL